MCLPVGRRYRLRGLSSSALSSTPCPSRQHAPCTYNVKDMHWADSLSCQEMRRGWDKVEMQQVGEGQEWSIVYQCCISSCDAVEAIMNACNTTQKTMNSKSAIPTITNYLEALHAVMSNMAKNRMLTTWSNSSMKQHFTSSLVGLHPQQSCQEVRSETWCMINVELLPPQILSHCNVQTHSLLRDGQPRTLELSSCPRGNTRSLTWVCLQPTKIVKSKHITPLQPRAQTDASTSSKKCLLSYRSFL